MGETVSGIVTILSALIAVAIVAVLVSKNASTGQVLSSGGTALSGVLQAALSPVSGVNSNALSAASTALGVSNSGSLLLGDPLSVVG